MKFVLAPDSFKETMTAARAAAAMTRGVRVVWPGAECVEVPMADGGEGTTQSLVDALEGEFREAQVVDALGRPRIARFGWIPSERLAVMEVAEAIGIEHISPADRDPKNSNTRGVGMVLNEILALDPKKIIIGLGGSATNDGGWGMSHELGVQLTDANGKQVTLSPLNLANAAHFDASALSSKWQDIEIELACDVDNPLTGERGATAVFGPQKGVTDADIAAFDDALKVWGDLLDEYAGKACSEVPGAGAAGGLGAALIAILGGTPKSGIDVVIKATKLEEKLDGADVVFTGEGSMDFQTKFGKTPWGVMRTARSLGIPTVAFAGNLGKGIGELYVDGFAAIVPTVREVGDLTAALAKAESSLEESVTMACRLMATTSFKKE